MKKIIMHILLGILIILTIVSSNVYAANKKMLGDINEDNVVDSRDQLQIMRHIMASARKTHPEWILSGDNFRLADITKNNKVDNSDLLIMLRYIAAKNNQEKIGSKHKEWLEIGEIDLNPNIEVESIKLNKTTISLDISGTKTVTLTATITPSTATDKSVTYTSSNTKIATVDQNGKVTAVGNGTATITAKTANGKTATCKAKVTTSPTSVKLTKTTISLDMSGTKTATLKSTISPSSATNKSVTYSSSNTKIATVDKSGKITAKKNGTATITVKTANGKTATCKVTVTTSPTSIKLNKTTLSLNMGTSKTATLKPTISPSTATNKSVTYSSSNAKVAVVDKNGKVTAKGKGKATITVKTSNKKTATCVVNVTEGYWEVKNGKYIYHYLNGTTKTWTISEYTGWKKLKEQNVKAKNPKAYTRKGNKFTYNGETRTYYAEDETANNFAIKNGVSPYAITVDLDRCHESVFKMNNGTWEPYKSAEVHIGMKWKNRNACPDLKTYTKNSVTPTGLYYLTGNRNNGKGLYWVGFGVQYKNNKSGAYGVNGHGPNKEDYLHSGEGKNYTVKKGGPCTNGCVVSSLEHAKWIYYNCGRGTPVLIW